MLPTLPPSWRALLAEELSKPYFCKLEQFLDKERQTFTIYPPEKDIADSSSKCNKW